jgi:hypothetical protein
MSHAEDQAQPRTFSPEGLVDLLDKDKLEEAQAIYQKVIKKNFNLSYLGDDYSHARYGAKKVSEKDGLIILEGQPWIRKGGFLIEMWDGAESTIKLHKKTMRIVYYQGNIIRTHFLQQEAEQVGDGDAEEAL